jgi:dolichol-phosphate mannosyltransferase
MRRARGGPGPLRLAQAGAAGLVLARLARGRHRRPPLGAGPQPPAPAGGVTVLVPARDEADRLGPCLAGLRADPDIGEVIVVDDRSADATADVARAGGARVVTGAPLPSGWVGKQWALQQGLEAARSRWLVTLDADTRPRPGLARALVAALAEADLVSAGPRFLCDTPLERLLHPSMLCSLVYRFGPVGAEGGRPARLVANGQCMAVDRERLAVAGGFGRARAHMTDDVALVRSLAGEGWRIAFLDGAALLSVRMHASAGELWREWGRSLGLTDVASRPAQALDLAVVWLTMALPLPRLLTGRGGGLDLVLAAVRVALLPAIARVYEPRGPAFWASPLADAATAVRLTASALRPARRWRGRTYPA